MGCDDFDEDFFEIVFAVFVAELGQGTFNEEFAGLDDANGVAELFDFGHDVGGEDYGFSVVAALADEGRDSAGGHDVEAIGGLVEDHDGGIVDESSGDRGFLDHAGGEFVAAAVAEAVHVEASEDSVDAFFESWLVEAVEAAKVFDKFLSGEAAIEGGSGGEEADVGADFFGMLDDVVAADGGCAVGGFENSGEHTEGGGFAGAVGAEEAVDFAGLAGEADVIDCFDFAALFVLEALGQGTSFDHEWTPRWQKSKDGGAMVLSLLRMRVEGNFRGE